MNQNEEHVRAMRLLAWIAGVSGAVLGVAFALAKVAPAGAQGVRAFAAWCGIG